MSDTPNIDALLVHVEYLLALLRDPHPGTHTWVEAYGREMQWISDFWNHDGSSNRPPDEAFRPSLPGGFYLSRDEFAAAALTGILASNIGGGGIVMINGFKKEFQEAAYVMADAMLAERSKTTSTP